MTLCRQTLQSQLEGTENRIAVARRDYILAVQEYNTELRSYPGRWLAGWPPARTMSLSSRYLSQSQFRLTQPLGSRYGRGEGTSEMGV